MLRSNRIVVIALLIACSALKLSLFAAKPVIEIPLQSSESAAGIGIGDLDGDGDFEYLVKVPGGNLDPYFHHSDLIDDTFKLEAYDAEKGLLWRYDMGWGIERGIWYSPVVVYDLDQDGKDEVYARWTDGDFRTAPKHQVADAAGSVVRLDSQTGEVSARAEWPGDVTPENYSRNQRHYMCIAYLDGENPSLIVGRGLYSTIRLWAYDKDLKLIWKWCSDDEDEADFSGTCSHGPRAVDLDGDGRDEISLGTAVVDEYGKGLWTVQKTHPDIHHIADIDPSNPGLEVFLAMEKHNSKELFVDDVFLLDAATGNKLWGNGKRAKHVHGTGVCADLIPEIPGMELYCEEKDARETWFYTAAGEPIPDPAGLGLTGCWGGVVAYYRTPEQTDLLEQLGEGYFPADIFERLSRILVADVLGDWREEVIAVGGGMIRVFSNAEASAYTGSNLTDDRYYRTQLATGNWLSGYYYQAQLSRPISELDKLGTQSQGG
jgi:hypothetical protein